MIKAAIVIVLTIIGGVIGSSIIGTDNTLTVIACYALPGGVIGALVAGAGIGAYEVIKEIVESN